MPVEELHSHINIPKDHSEAIYMNKNYCYKATMLNEIEYNYTPLPPGVYSEDSSMGQYLKIS